MKKFIIQIVGIILFLLLFLSLLDFSYTTVYEESNPRTKFQYFRSLKNTKVNYIFLGSSRVESGIDPSIIENRTKKKAINLGFQASKLGDIYTILTLLKTYNIASDSIFIQVDYIFDIKGHSINLPYEIAPFSRDSDVIKEYLINYVGEDPSTYYIPFARYCKNDEKIGFREVVANLIHKKTNVMQHKGYNPLHGIENQNKKHFSLPTSISLHSHFFEKIKRYAIENKIKIIFFCAPFCKHTKNLDYVKKLKTRIPDLYDFSNAIKEDSMFVNCFHLNEQGASKFTEILVKKVLKNNNKI